MNGLVTWWREEIARSPAMALVLLVWVINASMNGAMGHTVGGGGMWGLMLGAVFVAIAGLGSYAAHEQGAARGAMRGLLLLLVAFQLVLGQMAGWQSLGLTLSRGAASLETQAMDRDTAKKQLARARAERDRLGPVRPVAAIEAEQVLECEKKSRRYPDGVGPKCTALRAEMATAQRARLLDTQIPELMEALRKAPQIGKANATSEVPEVFSSAIASYVSGAPVVVSADQVRFGLLVFLVLVLEFIATLGPGLFGRNGATAPAGPRTGGGPGSRSFVAPSDAHMASGAWTHDHSQRGNAASMRDAVAEVVGGAFARLPAPVEPVQLQPAGPSSAHAHGSPIHIHFATPTPPLIGPPGVAHPEAAVSIAPPRGLTDEEVAKLKRERLELPALPADRPPVDRSRVARHLTDDEREAADVILAFRAACVPDAPGGVVTGDSIFKRYCHWAGPRALSEEAFHGLFADVTGIAAADIGGFRHYRGVALMAARKAELTVVAA